MNQQIPNWLGFGGPIGGSTAALMQQLQGYQQQAYEQRIYYPTYNQRPPALVSPPPEMEKPASGSALAWLDRRVNEMRVKL